MNGNYVTTSGSVLTEDERRAQTLAVREAIRQGHKFMKIKLTNEFNANMNQSEIKFNGVKTIFVSGAGRGKGNVQKYKVDVRGGSLVFYFKEFEEPTKDGWYADLLDDKLPAVYGEVGYNRDFLASHSESRWFKIIDPKVKHDVNARCKKIAEAVREKEIEKLNDRETYLKGLKEKKIMLEEEIKKAEETEGKTDADDKTGSGVD